MYLQCRHIQEQAERRLAIVLSPRSYNGKVGFALFCPVTSQIKGYPFEVVIPSGLKATGAILSDRVKSLDRKPGNTEFYDKLPENIIVEILRKLMTLLGSDK